MKNAPLHRSDYRWFTTITTRWMDNDLYGHINNVIYYSFFDTVSNRFLIEQGGLDIHRGKIIGYVVNSQCNYRSAIAYPDAIEGSLRTQRIGNSSVEYGIGIFRQHDSEASAYGSLTHVFVDRETERPVPIPDVIREALQNHHRAT